MTVKKVNFLRFPAHLSLLKIAVFATALLAVFFVINQARAQEEINRLDLTVSPPVIELAAKPGDTVVEKFRVRNNTDEPIVLQVEARRLISDPEDGNPVPEDEANGEELTWVTFDRPEFTANPNEWQDITFTIAIPEDAAYGYYYVFRITPKEGANIEASGAALQGEILVVTLLNVIQEGAVAKASLVSFKADEVINEYLPVDFTVKLKNDGNVHVKPRGNIFITRGGGPEMGILEVNPNSGSILPGGTREFQASWNDGFIIREPVVEDGEVKLDNNGNPVTVIKINWNKLTDFRIGPYEARLLMVYDDGTKDATIEGVATFWVIPYVAIGFIIVILIALFFIVRAFLRWYVRKETKSSRR